MRHRRREWFQNRSGFAALMEEYPTWLVVGASHQRKLVDALANMRNEIDHGQYGIHRGVAGPDDIVVYDRATPDRGCAIAYVATPAPALEDLDRYDDLLRRRYCADDDPSVVVVGRGVWDMDHADDGPEHLRLSHAAFLVRVRQRFPAAVIVNYVGHFAHVTREGCMDVARQVQSRDAQYCAVATANDLRANILVLDVFDMTATRRLVYGDGVTTTGAGGGGSSSSSIPKFSSWDAVPVSSQHAKVGDGHHYGAPVMMNIVVKMVDILSKHRHHHARPNPAAAAAAAAEQQRHPVAVPSAGSGASTVVFDDRVALPTYPWSLAAVRREARTAPWAGSVCRRCYGPPGTVMFEGALGCDMLRRRRMAACAGSPLLWANSTVWADLYRDFSSGNDSWTSGARYRGAVASKCADELEMLENQRAASRS